MRTEIEIGLQKNYNRSAALHKTDSPRTADEGALQAEDFDLVTSLDLKSQNI